MDYFIAGSTLQAVTMTNRQVVQATAQTTLAVTLIVIAVLVIAVVLIAIQVHQVLKVVALTLALTRVAVQVMRKHLARKREGISSGCLWNFSIR